MVAPSLNPVLATTSISAYCNASSSLNPCHRNAVLCLLVRAVDAYMVAIPQHLPANPCLARTAGEPPTPKILTFSFSPMISPVSMSETGLRAAVPTIAGRKRPHNATMPMDDSTTSPLRCPLRRLWPRLHGRVHDNHRRPSPDPVPAFDAGLTPELLRSRTHTRTHTHGLAKPTRPRC